MNFSDMREEPPEAVPQQGLQYDVTIIGGGVVGTAVARELSRYRLRVCLVERTEDVCSGTSKANSAIVHAGYDAETGTMKARMNVEGNRLIGELAEQLDFPFKRNGSLVLCLAREDRPALQQLYMRGVANGVPDLRILSGDEARAMEPNLSDGVDAALYAPTGGIVCPFGMTIAFAENACDNGVEFRFLTEVTEIQKLEGDVAAGAAAEGAGTAEGNARAAEAVPGYRLIIRGQEPITTRCVVNAAGVYADRFHNMVSRRKLSITPRKGDYCLLDKQAGGHVSRTIFQLPGKYGKGVLVTPTVHGNLLVGPTATDISDREGTYTTAAELEQVMTKAADGVKQIPFGQVITSFSGLRAHEEGGDFVIGEAEDAPGFFDAAGIESPGLSSAPAIGMYLARQIAARLRAEEKEDFIAERKGIPHVASLPPEERAELIARRPDYGAIVCRCENISEGEIVDSIRRRPGARSLDGIKRRVRQGMGRCQAGFCTPRTMEILSRETGIPMEQICKNRPGSEMLAGRL